MATTEHLMGHKTSNHLNAKGTKPHHTAKRAMDSYKSKMTPFSGEADPRLH